MGQGWLLYQDNAPCHKSQLLMGRRIRLTNGGTTLVPGWFLYPTFKFGGGPIMLWGQCPVPQVTTADGTPYSTHQWRNNGGTTLVSGWFKSNRVQLVSAPPYSPDLYVIENISVIAARGGPTKY
ncbi:unnamed protein product, partial [Mesorhabditis belari]|uniref:Uncharacterized protein n=1 Tax=Mesorhabditis belari TaxID=2138241 RepID=A0AAF3FDY3_9BILA